VGDWLLGMAFRIVMLMYSGKSLKCPTFWPLSNLPYFCKKSNSYTLLLPPAIFGVAQQRNALRMA